jgi:hypothetical protein
LIGLSFGPEIDKRTIAELNGSLGMQFGSPFMIEVRGSLYLLDDKLDSGFVRASFPGGVEFEGEETRQIGPLKLEANLAGSASSKTLEASGHATISATIDNVGVSVSGYGLVNNVGLAGCATATVGVVYHQTVNLGGFYRWNGQEGEFNDSCGFGRLKSALAARAAATAASPVLLRNPAGTRQINLIVRGVSRSPEVVLTKGGKTATIVPNSEGEWDGAGYIALADPETGDTDIAIAGLSAGNFAVAAPPGQPGLTDVGTVLPLPKPNVRVTVRPTGGRRYRLQWQATPIPGQTLVFNDRNARGQEQLLATSRSRGRLEFTAMENGLAGAQHIEVSVEQDGLIRELLRRATFRPGRVVLAKPRVSLSEVAGTDRVTWRAGPYAGYYEVLISTSDGRKLFFKNSPGDRALRVAGAPRVEVSVRAAGEALIPGPLAEATHVRPKPKPKPKHKG